MRINQIKVLNYKSFLNSDAIPFTSGFNVVVGQNNAGKTALLEALSLQFGDKRHRSTSTMPAKNAVLSGVSQVEVSFELDAGELPPFIKNYLPDFFLPLPPGAAQDGIVNGFLEAIANRSLLHCQFSAGSECFSAYLEALGKVTAFDTTIHFRFDR